ncbi:MAG TPA: glycosyltransferase [Methylomirabilota bacterium]|nr:glycosyltransferase [Methylomirabilota bacterium]
MTPAPLAAPAAELAVAVLTYNNAETIKSVITAAADGIARHFPDTTVALISADAGSADDTPALMHSAGLPVVSAPFEPPAGERVEVPFHGVPGRGEGLRAAFSAARTLHARALVVLEADVVSITPDWMRDLAGPILADKADFICPAYARHRWEGTVTRLVLAPLVRALYGRRIHQPFGGQQGLSARLLDHLLVHPKWDWTGRDVSDLWITGAAIADGFSVWEAWLGPYVVRSRTRTADLPAMVAETLGAAFTVMDRHQDLWREVRESEALPAVGEPQHVSMEPKDVDVGALLDAFQQGVRDLSSIWELILSPDTLGEVLALETSDPETFRFPDDLWARVVYDFALGHHYVVVHREHLLRSLVPLYLGRTAAYVAATRRAGAEATERALEAVAAAFERQKPYLVEHWR